MIPGLQTSDSHLVAVFRQLEFAPLSLISEKLQLLYCLDRAWEWRIAATNKFPQVTLREIEAVKLLFVLLFPAKSVGRRLLQLEDNFLLLNCYFPPCCLCTTVSSALEMGSRDTVRS